MSRGCFLRTVRALLTVWFLGTSWGTAGQVERVVGAGVRSHLTNADRVRVMVFLSVSSTISSRPDAFREAVARAQDQVLNGLSAREFTLKHRFLTVPALAGEISAAGLGRLVDLPGVVRVDLDEGGSGTLAQAIPLTNSDDVQALGFTGAGITVAILDSGIDTDHPDLADDLDGQACFCSGGGGCCPNGATTQVGTGAAEDNHGHGSNVAGIVTSRGVVSHAGVAPDARIVAIKVLDSSNSFCCSSDVVAGLDWIIANRPDVDIVNMSLGTSALFSGDCDNAAAFTMAYASAINTLRANGVTTFASAGNNGSGLQMTAPACVANALSVGAVWDSNVGPVTILGCTDATTAADKVTCFSNSDAATDLFAPGAPITSDWLFGGTSTFYGTSQASPHAAGCAADLLQAHPTLTPAQIEATLEATGSPVTDSTNSLTFPRIDCLAAFNSLTCNDSDGDGYGSPGVFTCPAGSPLDCNDMNAAVHPAAPQACDGVNNDCNHPAWPSTAGTNEADDDGDGLSECQGDCQDGNAQVWGTPGEAVSLALSQSGGTTTLTWGPPATGGTASAMLYDTLLSPNAANFSAGTNCVEANDGPGTASSDSTIPPAGQAFFFLIRAENACGTGPLGVASNGTPRTGRSCP